MKKVLSLVLAVVLTFGMASVAFAADNSGDTKVNYQGGAIFGHPKASAGYLDLGENVKPGQEEKISIDASKFAKGQTSLGLSSVTSSQLSSANYSVKRKVTKGSDVIDTLEVKNDGGKAIVKLEFIEPFVSTKDKDFDFTIYLAYKSSRKEDTELQIVGTLANEEIEVDEGDDEVDLTDNAYAKATAYVKAIKIDTGDGLYVNTKMFDGQKYYARSEQEITAADDAVIAKYPEIDTVYTLHTVNLSGAGNTVEFDISDTYYVYDATGKYIGTTADKLPMSSKYYLATAKIDMNAAGDVEEDDNNSTDVPNDGDTQNAGTGGDDVPENVNDNPGTGANGFVNVAVVAGLVAAVAAGAVSMKK